MHDQIMAALKGEHHGISMQEVLRRVDPQTVEEKDQFFRAWSDMRDLGVLIRTSAGFKAGSSPFGKSGWKK